MRFNILSDTDWQSKVGEALAVIDKLGYFEYFSERNYGDGLLGVTVVFMCQDSTLNLKQRIRLSKKEKKLYMDIMLDLSTMINSDSKQRQKIIIECLEREVPEILSKYAIDDFNRMQFNEDLQSWINSVRP
jgi:hypothetical protein